METPEAVQNFNAMNILFPLEHFLVAQSCMSYPDNVCRLQTHM